MEIEGRTLYSVSMSGHCGFLSKEVKYPIAEFTRAFMLLRHRGADDTGMVVQSKGNFVEYHKDDVPNLLNTQASCRILFGHHRLATIEKNEKAHQPFQDHSHLLLFDGEIYNYIDLRNELKRDKGVGFQTQSDTEVVFEALKHWKTKCFEKFNGTWSIAWINKENNEVLLSRDRLGHRPLYYFDDPLKLIFSSEMRFILRVLEHFKQRPTLNNRASEAYLRHGLLNHSEDTFWKGIKELPPGSWQRFSLNVKDKGETYWQLPKLGDPEKIPQLLSDSVELRMRADVGQGLLLSGGLDSALIAAEMAGRTSGMGPIGFYSAVYDRAEHGEENDIARTEKHFNIISTKVRIDSSKVKEHLDKCLLVNEEPFAAPNVISLYQLYREIRIQGRHKVLLNGLGADELFGGYPENGFMMLAGLIKHLHFLQFWLESKPMRNELGLAKTLSLVNQWRKFMQEHGLRDLCDYARHQILISPLREWLRYDDRLSAVSGLCNRNPFLDHRIVEASMGMSEDERFYKGTAKYRLRSMTRAKISDLFVSRMMPTSLEPRGLSSGKQGFLVPLEAWLESCFYDELLELEKQNSRSKTALAEFWKGRNSHSAWIWRQICFKRWKALWKA